MLVFISVQMIGTEVGRVCLEKDTVEARHENEVGEVRLKKELHAVRRERRKH